MGFRFDVVRNVSLFTNKKPYDKRCPMSGSRNAGKIRGRHAGNIVLPFALAAQPIVLCGVIAVFFSGCALAIPSLTAAPAPLRVVVGDKVGNVDVEAEFLTFKETVEAEVNKLPGVLSSRLASAGYQVVLQNQPHDFEIAVNQMSHCRLAASGSSCRFVARVTRSSKVVDLITVPGDAAGTLTFSDRGEYLEFVATSMVNELNRSRPMLALVSPSAAAAAAVPPSTPVQPAIKISAEPPPPASATDGSRAWAVVIGIERYRESLPPATGAEADARAVAALLKTTLGVPETHVKMLVGDRAGFADFRSVIEEWLPRNAREPGGAVYFYFSGHGAPDPETGDAYLVPYDADPAYLKTRGVAIKDVYEGLGRLPNQRVFVLLDACFSGTGGRSVMAAGARPLIMVASTHASANTIALAAAGPRETTGPSSNGGHGLFTSHLLGGLRGAADSNGDHAVTLAELFMYLRERVTREAHIQNREQTPTLEMPTELDPGQVTLVQGLR
jgi:hypothetical protein